MKLVRASLQFVSAILALSMLLIMGACAPVPTSQDAPDAMVEMQMEPAHASAKGAKLGTQWGEGIGSTITTVDLKRKSTQPLSVDVLAYAAFRATGEKIQELLTANGRVGLRVKKDNGTTWPIYRAGGADRLQGKSGERYTLEYRNYSKSTTYEVVATVDGLDVLSGQPGSIRNNGYILRPGETLQIKGFRKDASEVAAFRFSSAADSYAANNKAGSISNVGVIGTAIFELITPQLVRMPSAVPRCGKGPCAFAGDQGRSGYAKPPVYDE